MNRITQEAKKHQTVVKLAKRKGKSYASVKYGVSLSSVKRWCKRYDGTWKSLEDRSHHPHSHPKRHRAEEELLIKTAFKEKYMRYGWDGVYDEAVSQGYTRSFSGLIYAAKRIGLRAAGKPVKAPRKHDHRYPELLTPGEKVQIDGKEVPYNCLTGRVKRDGKHLYQWTVIDECTRFRMIYGFEELEYDTVLDEYTCQNGKKLTAVYERKRKSKSGFESTVTYYECEDCSLCPYKKSCTRAKGNRKLQVSKNFVRQRKESLERITSPEGILLRMNRFTQSEGVSSAF